MKITNMGKKIVRYRDLLEVAVADDGEPMVPIIGIPSGYRKGMSDMEQVTGRAIMVRRGVLDRLEQAQAILTGRHRNYSLYVTYGYRTLAIQTKRFIMRLKVQPFFNDPCELYEAVHRSVAVPTVAGHPTGGAVDLTVIDTRTGLELDFGSKMYDYGTGGYCVFSSEVTPSQKRNRMLLRDVMMKCGFAPFDGEWWHFSYGDREWAFYYGKSAALYRQI